MRGLKRVLSVLSASALLTTAAMVIETSPASAATVTFTVNDTGDAADATLANGVCATAGGVCTLRAAIAEASSVPGNTYTINFSVAGTFQAATKLPTINAATTIDGSTAPGYAVATGPVVTTRCDSESTGFDGFTINANNVTIRGIRIAMCTRAIRLVTGDHARIVGNQIGNDGVAFDATKAVGAAIVINQSDDTLIGGTTAADRNVISGFLAKGIHLETTATNAVVKGNYIGTNAAGTTAITHPNGTSTFTITEPTPTPNVAVESASPSALVQGNVISGNPGYGVVAYTSTANLTLKGNTIGLNAAGTGRMGNCGIGVEVQNLAHAQIGGTAAGEGNVIAGTRTCPGVYYLGAGIDINGSTATIQGNLIGTNATGTSAIDNGSGLRVTANTITSLPAAASHVVVGGTAAGAGNLISGNAFAGVALYDSGNSSIISDVVFQGNKVGTDITGTQPLGNGGTTLTVEARVAATIGGTAAGAGNLFSQASGTAIDITDNNSGVVVQGNRIGTNAAGTAALGTGNGKGIVTRRAAASVPSAGGATLLIGGSTAGSGNLVSGNRYTGIEVGGPFIVRGNLVGTNAAGTAAVPNSTGGTASPGIAVTGDGAIIGGSGANDGNTVSGNNYLGLSITANGATVLGNRFGTTAAGTGSIPNAVANIAVFGATSGQIGGVAAGEGNTITNDPHEGVLVRAQNISIRGNKIFNNTRLSIDLFQHDPAGAANGDQISPTLTTVTPGASTTAIAGTVRSDKVGPVLVDVYASNVCQATYGTGESKQYLGTISVPYPTPGTNQAFSGSVANSTVGSIITATSTVAGNGTSQFSPCAAVSDIAVTHQDTFTTAPIGADVGTLVTATNNGPTTATGLVLSIAGASGTETAADEAWADTPSKGVVDLGAGTWTIGSLASGASATVCLRADIVRDVATIDVGGGPIEFPAAFAPVISSDASTAVDPYRGNNQAEPFIQVGSPAVPGAAVCALPTLTIDDASVTRPSTGTTPLGFTVHLSSAQTRPVTVHYQAVNGTAVAIEDFTPTAGDLTIPAGQTTGTITVPVVGNQSDEPDKAFTLQLSAPKHATLSDTSAIGTVGANHVLGGCPPGSTSVQRFVCHLYFDALGRTPDPGGFTYWVGKLNKGTPRSTMATSYLVQPESLRKVADRAYVLYLARHGTNTELSSWATKLANKTATTQDVRIAVLSSAEYFTKTGGTNTLYIQTMFRDVFRRSVDASGLAYWTGQLAAGKTRTNVATRFMAEPEGRRKIVGDIYLRFLRRNPTTNEANGWVNQLAAGKTEVDVGIGLVASTEYFQRPTN